MRRDPEDSRRGLPFPVAHAHRRQRSTFEQARIPEAADVLRGAWSTAQELDSGILAASLELSLRTDVPNIEQVGRCWISLGGFERSRS